MIDEKFPDPSQKEVDRYVADDLKDLDRELDEKFRAHKLSDADLSSLSDISAPREQKEPDPDFMAESWRCITERMERNGYKLVYDGPVSMEEGAVTFPPSVRTEMFILGKRKMIFIKDL